MKDKVLVYNYIFSAIKQPDNSYVWEPDCATLDKLFLGMPWKAMIEPYLTRRDFYWGWEFRGDSDMHPIFEGKVELELQSITNPTLTLEIAVFPSKLEPVRRQMLDEILATYAKDEEFIVFWDDEDPEKLKPNHKAKVIKLISKYPVYKGENDITPEKCDVTPLEALQFFGYSKAQPPSQEEFKKKVRQLQLECHPDANNGNEKQFKHLQKCKKVLEEALFSDSV